MNAIINLFGNDTALNEYLVHKFVCRNKYEFGSKSESRGSFVWLEIGVTWF